MAVLKLRYAETIQAADFIAFQLRIALDAGQLQVDLLDETGSNILIKPVANIYMSQRHVFFRKLEI